MMRIGSGKRREDAESNQWRVLFQGESQFLSGFKWRNVEEKKRHMPLNNFKLPMDVSES